MTRRRYYSLFEKQGRRWVQLIDMGLFLNLARQYWQSALIQQRWTRPGPNYVPTTGQLMLRPTKTSVTAMPK